MGSGDKHGGSISENGGMSIWDAFKTLLVEFHGSGWLYFRRLATSICADCTILRGKMKAMYENGTMADVGTGVYIQHGFMVDVTKSHGGCV